MTRVFFRDYPPPPRVTAVEPLADHVLRVCFEGGTVKHYDVKPLLRLPMFQPLRDAELFREASVVSGGYAVAWNTDIDISEYELWQHGEIRDGSSFNRGRSGSKSSP